MPDISMCLNHSCKKRKSCYRYLATPHPTYQAYSDFDYSKDNCYWPTKQKKVKLSKKEKELQKENDLLKEHVKYLYSLVGKNK